jgi:predicted TIM-barrel fold metal-dependent hydrolase
MQAFPESEMYVSDQLSINADNEDLLYGQTEESHAEDIKVTEMGDFGIDYSIVTPGMNLALHTINNDRIQIQMAKAYNSWMVEEFLDDQEGIKGAILVADKPPHRAAEEIDRLADEDSIVAVYFSAGALDFGPGDEYYDPIYQAAEDHGLPLLLHATSISATADFPTQYRQMKTYTEQHAMTHAFTNMWAMISMMFKGMPVRFPDLKIVFQEAGIGWVPYWKFRLNDHYMEYESQLPHLEQLPSKYMDDLYYYTTQPLGLSTDAGQIANLIELAGTENVLYSSDLPHPDFDPPQELFNRVRSRLSDSAVRGVMGENAMELFNL